MKAKKTTGFTITELMVATAIVALVLAAVSIVLIGTLKDWLSGSANARMSIQGRILRERLAGGIQGQFGLRHASRNSLVYTNNSIQFLDSDSGKRFTILLQTNAPLCVQDAGGANVFAGKSDILLRSYAVTWASNVLVLDLTFSMNDGLWTYTQAQQIKTYLLNE